MLKLISDHQKKDLPRQEIFLLSNAFQIDWNELKQLSNSQTNNFHSNSQEIKPTRKPSGKKITSLRPLKEITCLEGKLMHCHLGQTLPLAAKKCRFESNIALSQRGREYKSSQAVILWCQEKKQA